MPRVLIIERNEKIGGLISGQLKQQGYEATDVRHGAEAVMALRQNETDLILLDNQVPMGGLKTARILRLHEKYNTIPIILGLPPDKKEAKEVIQEGQKVGLHNFLMKPFTLNALREKLDEALKNGKPEQPTHQEIRDEIRNLSNLPAMPATHAKLLSLMSKADEEVDMRQVSNTLEQDPAPVGQGHEDVPLRAFRFSGQHDVAGRRFSRGSHGPQDRAVGGDLQRLRR